jgi:predicted nucleic acid-binding protein
VQDPVAPPTLLDACAVVNLYATRWMGAILAANGGPFAVAEVVMREAQFVLRGGTGEDAREREPVDRQSLQDAGLLEMITSDDEEELLTFIDLSAQIDDGEAMTAALAMHRGCIVVTDDRKASRVLVAHGVVLRTTLDLIRTWSNGSTVTQEIVRVALADLRQRGNYDPPKGHPLRDWWDDVMTLA